MGYMGQRTGFTECHRCVFNKSYVYQDVYEDIVITCLPYLLVKFNNFSYRVFRHFSHQNLHICPIFCPLETASQRLGYVY